MIKDHSKTIKIQPKSDDTLDTILGALLTPIILYILFSIGVNVIFPIAKGVVTYPSRVIESIAE